MAGVHGLKHVDDFFATRFTHDDAVWTHTKCVSQTIALGYSTFAFHVGRTAFHPTHVCLLQLKFRRILDCQDAFIVVDEGRQRVQRGRFTGTGTARDDDVQAGCHGCLQIGGHFFGEGTEVDQIVDRKAFPF